VPRQSIAHSERRFRAVVENSADAIKLVTREGVIAYASPAAARILGYEEREHVGSSVFEHVHPDDLDRARAMFAESLASPGRPVYGRLRRRHKNGCYRQLEVVRVNWLDDPAISAIVTNYRDITDRLALEEQLMQSQKMEAIGRLAGGIAHDFNNLLTAILSYAGFALSALRSDDPLRDDINEIQKAGERAAALTYQLLAFSRRQILAPRVTDLNGVIDDLEKMLRRVLGEDIEFHTALAEWLAPTKLDPSQLEQVILNLAVNARDAMPNGGMLSIETANVALDAEYARQHSEVVPGAYVMLAISDSGVGMTSAVRARAFEPFFTTKEVGKGTGLGLSTVFGIVRQSGGHIWVYSEPDHGTTFKLYFPVTNEALPPAFPRTRTLGLHSGTEVVLVAEDEPAVRDIARKMLQRAGYVVLEASNGGEALLIAEQHKGAIDLLLTDVVMPRMSGRTLAERLLTVRPALKVLFMSGYTENAIVQHAVLDSDTQFVQKPLTPELLLRKVREVLDGVVSEA
jgi:PAS domain S-box-containing protein